MTKKINSLVIFLICSIAAFAQPTNNPIKEFYQDSAIGYPGWTDEVNWLNVHVMSDQGSGSANFAYFQTKCLDVYNEGGGVLYYPAGTYEFDIPDSPNGEGLMLMEGVVIRGATPSSDLSAVTNRDISSSLVTEHGLKSLPTKFVFDTTTFFNGAVPKMWNCIGAKAAPGQSTCGEASYIGVAWVEMEYGYIHFGWGANRWADTWGTSPFWFGPGSVGRPWETRVPDGTHIMDGFAGIHTTDEDTAIWGEKRFVFGCNLQNAAVPNYVSNPLKEDYNIIEPGSWQFGGKISVHGSDIFVANNVIEKPTACFIMPNGWKCNGSHASQGDIIDYRYDYGYGIGIDINKSIVAVMYNKCQMDGPVVGAYYNPNVQVVDNWVYNHGNKGIEVAGKYMVLRNNVNWRDYLDWSDDPYGIGTVSYGVNPSNGKCWYAESVDDMMSRAYDLAGWNVWAHNNRWKTTGTNYANDGEGILYQRHNGVEVYSCAKTHNFGVPRGGQGGYIAPYDCHVIGLFHGFNTQNGAIGAMAMADNYGEDISALELINWTTSGSPNTNIKGTTGANVQDFLTTCTSPTILDTAINVSVHLDEVQRNVTIEWDDNTSNEIAYRVERKCLSDSHDWVTIAYRPRQETSSSIPLSDTMLSNVGNYRKPKMQCFPSTLTTNDMNPPKWIDYNVDVNKTYEYRIVTLDCDDDTTVSTKPVVTDMSQVFFKTSETIVTGRLDIVPNPVENISTISYDLPEGIIAKVEVISLDGKTVKVLANETNNTSVNIDADSLEKGLYVVKVSKSNGFSVSDKLLIK